MTWWSAETPPSPTTLGGGAAMAIGLVAAGSFFGSSFLVLAGMAGVPIAIVGIAIVHLVSLWDRSNATDDARKALVENHCRRWQQRFQELRELVERVGLPEDQRTEFWDRIQETLSPKIELVVGEEGLRVEPSADEIRGLWLKQTDRSIDEAEEWAGQSARTTLQDRQDFLRDRFPESLEDVEELPEEDLRSVCESFESALHRIEDEVEEDLRSTEEAISRAETQGLEVADAWEDIEAAQEHWDNGQVELAIRALEEARSQIHNQRRPHFEERRDRLATALDRLLDLRLQGLVPPALLDRAEALDDEASGLKIGDDGMSSIEEAEERFISVAKDVHRNAVKRAREAREKLSEYPALADVGELDKILDEMTADEIALAHPYQETFDRWADVAAKNFPRFQTYLELADLVRYYPSLEENISETLSEQGHVKPSDVPVDRRAREVLQIYHDQHPDRTRLEDGVLHGGERSDG